MHNASMNNVIATRDFELEGTRKATIVVGMPFATDASNQEFWCPYQIIGFGSEKIKHGIGADSLQALCIALHKAGTDLYFSSEYKAAKLRWEGGMTISDLGLPVSDGMLDDVKRAKAQFETLKNLAAGSSP